MIYFLSSPLIWMLLLAAGLLLFWHRLRRWVRVPALMLVGLMFVLLTPLGGNFLIRQVESSIPTGMDCGQAARDWPHTVPIVLMSAGFEMDPAVNDDYVALSPESWRRLRAAVLLWQQQPETPLFISGGGPFATKESVVLARLAQDWGVPESALHLESQSATTWESAFALRAMTGGRVRVVSSALHVPRSLVAFRAAGFQACGQASDSDYQPPGGPGYYLPQLSGLHKSEMAIYEILGTWLYRYRARALLRAPPEAAPVRRGAPTT